MTLALYGKENIGELESYANSLFSSIPNKNIELPVHNKPNFESVMTLTKIYPVENTNILKLLWPLPSQIPLFREFPSGYLSALLGHGGKIV
jgi:insulysin